jgi:hypothetical protein
MQTRRADGPVCQSYFLAGYFTEIQFEQGNVRDRAHIQVPNMSGITTGYRPDERWPESIDDGAPGVDSIGLANTASMHPPAQAIEAR